MQSLDFGRMGAKKTPPKHDCEICLICRVEAKKKSGGCCMCQLLIAENAASNEVMMAVLQLVFDLVSNSFFMDFSIF